MIVKSKWWLIFFSKNLLSLDNQQFSKMKIAMAFSRYFLNFKTKSKSSSKVLALKNKIYKQTNFKKKMKIIRLFR